MLICIVLYLMYTFNLMWNQYVHQVTSLNVCRTHLTGAIDHGHGVHCYIDLLTWPHDANLIINVLMDLILKREKLPPVLYLQLDNTARENKNKFLMAFLTYLVQTGVFREVSTIICSRCIRS